MTDDPVTQLLADPRFNGSPITWEATPEGYDTIRHHWLTHVSAEERLFSPFSEGEFQAQLETMLAVFSDHCVMELVPTGERWEGRKQTEAFYRTFLGAFTGMEWTPQALVIGPQGVLDVVNMTGTQVQPFCGRSGDGLPVHLQWVISFPWIPEEERFRGETVYSIHPVGQA